MPMHPKDEAHLRIRMARQFAGKSQAELAQALGVGRSAVANWECGRAHPSAPHLSRLARVTDVAFEWLATGQGVMTAASSSEQHDAGVLNQEESTLLQAFRGASKKRQRQILYIAMSLSTAAAAASALADLLALGGG